MEAMWTRFLPATMALMKVIDSGVIGDVIFFQADFSKKIEKNLEGRFYNLELAGGSIMDLGIYPISYASMIFGRQPDKIFATATMYDTGIDERCTQLFDYGEGKGAMLTTSLAFYGRQFALIAGTKGSIEVHDFYRASEFTIKVNGKTTTYKVPFISTGKGYEAKEVMNCIGAGKSQSDIMPMDETVAIMGTIDQVRKQIGLVYTEEMEQTVI
jgi:predicted dehydrogenase